MLDSAPYLGYSNVFTYTYAPVEKYNMSNIDIDITEFNAINTEADFTKHGMGLIKSVSKVIKSSQHEIKTNNKLHNKKYQIRTNDKIQNGIHIIFKGLSTNGHDLGNVNYVNEFIRRDPNTGEELNRISFVNDPDGTLVDGWEFTLEDVIKLFYSFGYNNIYIVDVTCQTLSTNNRMSSRQLKDRMNGGYKRKSTNKKRTKTKRTNKKRTNKKRTNKKRTNIKRKSTKTKR